MPVDTVTDFLTIGIILGLSAGFAPGPLLALVVSETLKHGFMSGVKVAVAPIISDLPIIFLTLVIATKLAGFQSALGIISLAGGVFILHAGYNCIRTQTQTVAIRPEPSGSLFKGVMVNVLNPHPYLFWLSVGAPTISRALKSGVMEVTAFLGAFYLVLVGAKILLAIAVARSRSFLCGRLYQQTLRFLGMLLLAFALVLFRDGAKLLGLY